MIRANIYLDQECHQYLHQQSSESGKPVSALVRAIIRDYMNRDVNKILQAADGIHGLWKDRRMDVDAYVREQRRDRVFHRGGGKIAARNLKNKKRP